MGNYEGNKKGEIEKVLGRRNYERRGRGGQSYKWVRLIAEGFLCTQCTKASRRASFLPRELKNRRQEKERVTT